MSFRSSLVLAISGASLSACLAEAPSADTFWGDIAGCYMAPSIGLIDLSDQSLSVANEEISEKLNLSYDGRTSDLAISIRPRLYLQKVEEGGLAYREIAQYAERDLAQGVERSALWATIPNSRIGELLRLNFPGRDGLVATKVDCED